MNIMAMFSANCGRLFDFRAFRCPAFVGILAFGLCAVACAAAAADDAGPRSRILMFSRSALFEHPVIARHGDELSFAEKAFVDLARRINCDAECTKDLHVILVQDCSGMRKDAAADAK